MLHSDVGLRCHWLLASQWQRLTIRSVPIPNLDNALVHCALFCRVQYPELIP